MSNIAEVGSASSPGLVRFLLARFSFPSSVLYTMLSYEAIFLFLWVDIYIYIYISESQIKHNKGEASRIVWIWTGRRGRSLDETVTVTAGATHAVVPWFVWSSAWFLHPARPGEWLICRSWWEIDGGSHNKGRSKRYHAKTATTVTS